MLALLLIMAAGCGSASGLRQLSLKDAEGDWVKPFQTSGATAHVFLFTRIDCPVSNRYLPEIRRLKETLGPQGVVFWRVYPNPDVEASDMRRHGETFGIDIPALHDPAHQLVQAAGATITPEAAVYLPDGKLVYRGRIDDRYIEFGQYRRVPTRHDLREVLEQVVSGAPPPFRSSKAVGCYIADLRPRS